MNRPVWLSKLTRARFTLRAVVLAGTSAAALIVLAAALLTHRPWAKWTDPRRPVATAPPLPQAGRPGSPAEGLQLMPVKPQDAVALNAARAFSTAPRHAPRPFASQLQGSDFARAVGCLAMAALYEAGGARSDQTAVMQVVLNRVRHPAFPKTVCGVVFQGAERRTGCQFSFTCDGSMRRWQPSARALEQAKILAAEMLDKAVDPRVGLATHYHTNWVLPYWSASLAKVAAVETHLFFRWHGFWGEPGAFLRRPSAAEPAIPQLAAFEKSHGAQIEPVLSAMPLGEDLASGGEEEWATVNEVPAARAIAIPDTARVLVLNPQAGPGRWSLDAVAACGEEAECRLAGWTDPAQVPSALDRSSLAASPPHFAYVQDLPNRVQQAYWNCQRWPRLGTAKCLQSPSATAELLSRK